MVLKIEKDHQRFRQIVRGRIRGDGEQDDWSMRSERSCPT